MAPALSHGMTFCSWRIKDTHTHMHIHTQSCFVWSFCSELFNSIQENDKPEEKEVFSVV